MPDKKSEVLTRLLRWEMDKSGRGTVDVYSALGSSILRESYEFSSLQELPPWVEVFIRRDGRLEGMIP